MVDRSSPGEPHRSRAERGMQLLANAAVVVAGAAVVWLALQRIGPTPPDRPMYAVGEQMDAVDGVDFREAPATLLMALREDCRYCRDSVPFYRRLSAARARESSPRVRVVVLTTDQVASMSAYLESNGIDADGVVTIRPGSLKIPGTPFLLLVDQRGTVKQVWRGKLFAPQESEVFAELSLQPGE